MSKEDGRFKKGGIPWNKGKKGIHLSPRTEFKKGKFVGEKHPCWKGGAQKHGKDCIYVWAGNGKRKRRPVAVYEANYGPVPAGMIVWHIDGDRTNDVPANLEIITRAECIKRNNPKLKRE